MAASWKASGTLLGSTGADITPVIPTHAANDILILHAAARSNAVTLATPSGWTLIAGPTDSGTTWRNYWFYKRAASGSETNPLCDWSATTGDKYSVVHVVQDAITSGTPYGAQQATAGTADPGSATGITTVADNALVMSLGMSADNLANSVTITGTNPTPLTVHAYNTITTGADAGRWAASALRATAGATGNYSHDFNGVPLAWGILIIAFKPVAAVPSQMSGTGGIAASGAGVMRSMSRQSGTGSATVSGTGVQRSVSRMTGAGGISASGTSVMRSMSLMGATGAITATGTGNMSGPPSEMSATGSVTATGAGTMRSLSRMTATGTIAVTGAGVQKSWSRQAGTGSITAAGAGAMQALSRMVGAGTVSVVGTGFMGQDGPPTSAMSGTGALTVSGTGTMRAESRMSASGTIAVVGGGVLLSLSRMTAAGSITVTGTAAHSGDVPGTVVGAVARWGAVTGNVATSGGTTSASEAEGGVAGATEAAD